MISPPLCLPLFPLHIMAMKGQLLEGGHCSPLRAAPGALGGREGVGLHSLLTPTSPACPLWTSSVLAAWVAPF